MTPINPIWSIERALRNGYVMEPHETTGNFSGPLRMSRPSHDCALVKSQVYRDMVDPAMKDQHWGREACAKQCDECASICHMNDYIRAKPHCPPNYPMPATLDNADTATGWYILSSCPHYNGPCKVCITKWEDQMLYDFPFLD